MTTVIQFIKNVYTEIRLVDWLPLPQTARLTLLVLVLSIIIGIIIVAFDYLFLNLRNLILSI